MQRFFITAPGTGVGKTLVTAALAFQLSQQEKNVTALKPVISGYDPADEQSDTALILKSCGIEPTVKAMEAISPWRFSLPLAPDMAAAKEKKPQVDMEKLVELCRNPLSLRERGRGEGNASGKALIRRFAPPSPGGRRDFLLVEGIGGVMSPINNHHTVLDWMESLGWPVIMVSGSYLGAISHTLAALEVVRGRNLSTAALIISESESGVALDDTAATLKKFLLAPIPVVIIPRIAAPGDRWKYAPPISGICA